MKVCKLGSYSIKTVTVICINTPFSSIAFIAHQTSANKTSHCHCFLISVIIIACFIILSLFNPVLICKFSFISSALILLFNFNFATFIWPITRSISALECGIGYIIIRWVKTARFSYGISPMASPYKHTSFQYATVSEHFANGQLSNSASSRLFSFPNDFTFYPNYPTTKLRVL